MALGLYSRSCRDGAALPSEGPGLVFSYLLGFRETGGWGWGDPHWPPSVGSYVSAMVPVKSPREYYVQQEVIVRFCETVER